MALLLAGIKSPHAAPASTISFAISVPRICLVILSLLLRYAASLRHHARAPAWFPALWYLSTEGRTCFELIPPPSPLAVYFSCLVCKAPHAHASHTIPPLPHPGPSAPYQYIRFVPFFPRQLGRVMP
ncbi:hypothetical protein EDB80DRAFT_430419 [Ilyonectria destructans]|nr:hypothetical protein EDB80DRAFT_430419 [Ilyonectria destructans]